MPAQSPPAEPALPLQGVRVLSMAELYPGPYATLLLADLGAEVILLERAQGGDPARQLPMFFAALNRGKKSVAIDLKQADGPAQVRRLMRTADMFLEGFRPGVLDRFGLGYRQVAEDNPALIYISISGFGQTGPYRDRPAHDISFQALAGLLQGYGRDGARPAPSVPIADLSAGLFAVIGGLAALHRRRESGRGCHVDVAMADGLVSLMTGQLAPLLNGKPVPDPAESPAYGLFRCADGRDLSLSVVHEDALWDRLCAAVDLADAAGLDFAERLRDGARLRDRLAARIAASPQGHWLTVFEAAGVPCAPVNRLADVIRDPHFLSRGMFVEVERPGDGTEMHVRQPLRFDGAAPAPRSAAPKLGADSAAFLTTTTAE